MKITSAVSMASALLLAAGCAHEQNHAQYDENMSPNYSSGRMSDYNPDKNKNQVSENMSGQKSRSESDSAIVADVREKLRSDAKTAPLIPNIQITANNGLVLLNGTVQSAEQKQQIETLAQRAAGAVAVNNQLKVLSLPNDMNNGPLLEPTGTEAPLPRLYKDAAEGTDQSTNNALNPASIPKGGPSQIYKEDDSGQNAPPEATETGPML